MGQAALSTTGQKGQQGNDVVKNQGPALGVNPIPLHGMWQWSGKEVVFSFYQFSSYSSLLNSPEKFWHEMCRRV